MNIHPLIVHFPIALLLTSVLADLLALLRLRTVFKDVALFLLILGVIGAVAAGVSGERAAEAVAHLPDLREAVEQHEDFATGTIWLFIALLLSRLYMVIKGRFVSIFRAAYFIVSLAAGGLLMATAYSGGNLVYERGAGVKPVMNQAFPAER
ncbi:MAG: hypothetical protein A3F84_23450 [Candidatus Handelsmanbacteria bacterium RIFCSPLOWO2_12_FULL_64_10]|uniref:DUF2231 domain-containing protein n=1 Tax=Handelsmanbacteria sp. (strain RIFCSPLOWO2_12_FULL_64_10) TaxID=1817868 RepID=A0A1F6CR99_HANXR|nr:MAG: hypothetical protein A3F84_23450 [Candidatus Handelsmanbacteria bacterium RIFCSPLOWO2_12_FULL_64_10]